MTRQTLTIPKRSHRLHHLYQAILAAVLIAASLLLPASARIYAAPVNVQPAAPLTIEQPSAAPAVLAAPFVAAPAAPTADQANLAVTAVAASPTVVVPGGQIQYNVTVTNNGPNAAQAVEVVLSLTRINFYLNIVSGTSSADWSCTTAVDQLTSSCTRSTDMPSGTSEMITFLLNPDYLGLYYGAYVQATVSSTTEDPDTTDNIAHPGDVNVTSLATDADLVAEYGTFDPSASVPAGSLTTLRFAARNGGPASTPYTATLNVAAGTQIMGVYAYEYGCSNSSTSITCAHGVGYRANPTPDTSAPIYALLLAPTTIGNYDQEIIAASPLSDPLPGNNTRNATLTVTEPGTTADLQVVSAETGPASVNPGATVFYTVTVRNNGPEAASQVLVWVPMFPHTDPELRGENIKGSGPLPPTGWDCKRDAWARGWYCTTPELKAGTDATLLFRFPAPSSANIYLDRPAIGSQTGDPDTANNIGSATLTVNKTEAPVANITARFIQTDPWQTPFPSGGSKTLTFRTVNDGPDSAAHGYVGVFWDYYGAKWSLGSYVAPAGWNCTVAPGAGGMDCFAESVAAGADEKWTVTLIAPTVTTLTDMRACILADSETVNTAYTYIDVKHKFECDWTYVTPIHANIRITGRANPAPVNAGGSLIYTLVVHNDGPDDMFNGYYRTLYLQVAPGVAFQRLEGADGWVVVTTLGESYQFYWPVLASGESTTARVTVLAPSIIGSIVATATIRGSDYDVDLANNRLVITTSVTLDGQAADLGIALAAPAEICIGQRSNVTATVSSLGLDLAIQPTVVFTAPVNMAIQAASSADFLCSVDSSTNATCTRSDLSRGSSSTIHFALLALSAGNANLQVSVDSDTPDDNQFDNSASVNTTVKTCQPPSAGKIAYIFNGEPIAADYETLLESRGYTVDLIGLNAITSTALSGYDLFLLGDDSGRYPGDRERFTWGTQQATTAAQMAPIIAANKPVIGLGEGGSIYLEKRGLSIGWLHAWYQTGDNDLNRAPFAPVTIFASPNLIPADPVKVYSNNLWSLNVYGPRMNPTAFPIGTEIPDGKHFSITGEACHFGWGFRNGPTDMTADGKNLFHNLVAYAIHFQCPKPVTPPANCVSISKSSNPPHGSQVQVSDVGHYGLITYTLSYNLSADPLCANRKAKLVDVLPPDTELLPGSASDGISADASRALIWTIAPGTSGTKQFTVVVLDSACRANETIHNRARLTMPGRDPLESNEVKHEAKCSPVIGDNKNPPFAQDELEVFPYPIIAGRVHTVSVRLINRTATAQTVNVNFQTSSQVFGIGIPFTPFATRSVTIPAHGNVILSVPATFAVNGHYCIQVTVEIPGFGTITSQRNIDVMEDLQPGMPDVLNFKVGNPLGFATDIALEVDNTCPGFSAVVSPILLSGMAPGEARNATLTTTPPNPVLLGSGCHIDIKGYAVVGGSRIPLGSGIRKLDVPPIPVTIPSGMAWWLSPYISFQHDPPVAGVPNQICIELQNPLPVTKTVTLVYNLAQLGAGIPFTPIATRAVDLPPNSSAKYCIDWTPPAIDYYCVKIEVQLPGWRPQFAQRNVDVRTAWRPDLTIPFVIRNPDLISHRLRIDLTQWGIDPNLFQPVIRIPKPVGDPDPQPNEIAAGQQLQLELAFMPVSVAAAGLTPTQAAATTFGDVQRVDVAVSMDGKESSGLSVVFTPQEQGPKVFLPLVQR